MIPWDITVRGKYNELVIKGKFIMHLAGAQGLNKPNVSENVIYKLQSKTRIHLFACPCLH